MPISRFDEEVVKKPYSKSQYTEDTIFHVMQCMDDPMYFMENFLKIQHPTRGALRFEPYDFQRRIIEGIHTHKNSIVLAGRQLGKALALDTPIATPSGWTTMGALRVGDQIYGADGRPCRVTFATEVMHEHDCFEVEFDNGEIIVADAEHLWEVKTGKWARSRVITTREMVHQLESAKRLDQGLSIAAAKPLQCEAVELPIPPYTLGVWLGDGNAADGRFHTHVEDAPDIRAAIAEDGFVVRDGIRDQRGNCQRQTVIGLRAKLLESHVLNNKHIPEIYFRASQEQRLELLRGLMDTDGYADRSGGCEFYQKSLDFVMQVRHLLSSLGIKSRVKVKEMNGVAYHTLRFATADLCLFKLKRKQEIQRRTLGHQKTRRHYVVAVRQTPSVPVRCIQVDSPDHLFLCGRTMIPTHNTTVAVGYLLWKAIFTADTTILITANKLDQALEIMSRIRYAYENLPDYIRAGVVEYNKGSIAFDNGSKIVSRATSTDAGRGLAVSLLYCDEFAFVPPNKAAEFWTSIQPVLSEGGSCIITSTPKNDEDQFAQIWRGAIDNTDEYGVPNPTGVGKNGFFAIKVTWREHPHRDEEWAAPFRASLGEAKFRQEYEAEFITDDETLIDPLTLASMTGMREPLFYTGTVRWYADPEPNRAFLIGLDPSLGSGGDYAAIQVFQIPEMIQIAEWHHNRTVPRRQIEILVSILTYIRQTLKDDYDQSGEPDIYWTIENNTIGEANLVVIEDTGEENFPGMLVNERKRKGQTRRFRKGLTTDNKKKLSACARLKSLIESGRMKINSPVLVKQLKNFVAKDVTYSAKPGEHDDCVTATLLICRMLDVVLHWSLEMKHPLREQIDPNETYQEPMPVGVLIN